MSETQKEVSFNRKLNPAFQTSAGSVLHPPYRLSAGSVSGITINPMEIGLSVIGPPKADAIFTRPSERKMLDRDDRPQLDDCP